MYTVKTNPSEADAVLRGDKMFVFRADSPQYVKGNNISFAVIDEKRVTPHPLEDRVFKITHIERGDPIADGIIAVGFIRIK
jgi:hypothetical protein